MVLKIALNMKLFLILSHLIITLYMTVYCSVECMTKYKGIIYFYIIYLSHFWTTNLLNVPYLQKRKHCKMLLYKILVHFQNINLLRCNLYWIKCNHFKNTVQWVLKNRSVHVTAPSSRYKTSSSQKVSPSPFAATTDLFSLTIDWFAFSSFPNK